VLPRKGSWCAKSLRSSTWRAAPLGRGRDVDDDQRWLAVRADPRRAGSGPSPGDLRQPPTAAYEEVPALKFRRALEQPVREHPENALDAVLRLANSTDFQDARRALHTAEALAAAVAFAELARAI